MGRKDFSEVKAGSVEIRWSWVRARTGLSAPLGKGVARVPSLCPEIRREEVYGTARLLVD